MALKSYLFSGDRALQACLVHDSAHVNEGASGEHVAKIQAALKFLEGASIEIREIRSKLYGPSTAAAVLGYKQKRKIINHAYQTQADNIVGKMTIAALDKELVSKQEIVVPRGGPCRRAR
jgi:peptidoglycan hydrolase-like protein with peptidoglycan-binding domain